MCGSLPPLGRLAAVLVCACACVDAKLVHPTIPPRGMNSFDIQYAHRNPNATAVPIWNETEFRRLASAMASQLLPVGFDTIVIDGGWAGNTIDGHGRPTPNTDMWPSAAGGKGFKPLADWTHSLGLKFGVWTLRGVLPARETFHHLSPIPWCLLENRAGLLHCPL
jgi:hypothetical protein